MNDFIKFLSISVRIFGFFGKILDFSSKLSFSPGNIGNCLASGSSEGLRLKGQVLIIQRKGEWGEFPREGEVLVRELLWGTWGYSKGIGIIKGKEENDVKSGAWDKEAKQEQPEPSGAILSFLNHFFALVNFKILFCKGAILDCRFEGSVKISIKITISFSSGNLLCYHSPIQFWGN